MDRLEMIEKLRERADISYEEAKDILERAQGDLLEAIVLLEKEGKMRQPEMNAAAAAAAEDAAHGNDAATAQEAAAEPVQTALAEKEQKAKKASGFKKAVRGFVDFLTQTSFHVTRKDTEIFAMPSVVFAALLFFFWEPILPAMVIALFFDVRYHFTGRENTETANEILDKAGSFVDGIESSLQNEA